MTDQQTLRQQILDESEVYGSKRRFGLFSQAVSTAVGDNGAYKRKLHPRDPGSNKPVTEPKNFLTSPNKVGHRASDYFGQINSLATSHMKDQFIEPERRLIKEEKMNRDYRRKQVSFFTGAGNKILNKSSYEYIEQKNPELDPKRNRQEDGRVKSIPKNFYTNPQSKVEKAVFKPYQHLRDQYERRHQKELEDSRRNKSLEGENKFKPNSFAPQLFNSEKKVRELDVEIKKVSIAQSIEVKALGSAKYQKARQSLETNKSKQIIQCGAIDPFPVYKENPPVQLKRKPADEAKKQSFKLMSPKVLATPTCSITLHRTNILRGRH